MSAHDWGVRILTRCNEITAALATRLQETEPTLGRIAISTAVLGLFIYWLILAPSVAGFFIVFSLAITGSYFAYQDRLLLPIYVVFVPLVAEALHRVVRSMLGARLATGFVAVLLAGVCLVDFSPRADWSEIEERYERLVDITETLAAELPSDARLATVRGFHLSMLLDRPVYSIRWGYRLGAGMDGIDSVIDRYSVNTLVLDPSDRLDVEYEPALVAKYGDGRSMGAVRVLRVRD